LFDDIVPIPADVIGAGHGVFLSVRLVAFSGSLSGPE
jgi:hypothetical protein